MSNNYSVWLWSMPKYGKESANLDVDAKGYFTRQILILVESRAIVF